METGGTLGLRAIILTNICGSIKNFCIARCYSGKICFEKSLCLKNDISHLISMSLCLIGSWFSKFSRYRGNWRGDLPEGKGEYQVLWLWIFEYICTSVSVTFANISSKSWNFWIQKLNDSLMQIFSFSGQTGTSLWESLVLVFQVERVFMRQNLAISSLEGGSNSCCWLWLICWTVLRWRLRLFNCVVPALNKARRSTLQGVPKKTHFQNATGATVHWRNHAVANNPCVWKSNFVRFLLSLSRIRPSK